MLAGSPPRDLGKFVPSDLLNRSVLEANPIDSIKLKPAPGTCVSASFSEGSMVM